MPGREVVMASEWFAIVEIATSELFSVATVVADPLPGRFKTIKLSGQPDFSVEMWDKATEVIVAKPPPPSPRDRVNDIMNEPEFLLLDLLAREGTRAAIIRNLNEVELRYY